MEKRKLFREILAMFPTALLSLPERSAMGEHVCPHSCSGAVSSVGSRVTGQLADRILGAVGPSKIEASTGV